MKIGISFQAPNGSETYRLIKKCGFDCADINLSSTETPFYTLPEADALKLIEKEKAMSRTAGIEINQVHGPWQCPPKDFSVNDRKERMEKMKKAIRFTSRLGCKNFVIHPIMPFGLNDIGKPEEGGTLELNQEFMTELLKEAIENDVTICLENMPFTEFSLSKPADILKFVKTINDENLKICLDTGHAAILVGQSVGDVVRELGDEIRVLHVHDNKCQLDLHLPPMYGVIDWNDFVKALSEIQYAGVLSLEIKSALQDTDFHETTFKYYADIARYLIKQHS